MPGEGEAFVVVEGWDANPADLGGKPGSSCTVPPRGLAPAAHLALAQECAFSQHPLAAPPGLPAGPALAIAAQAALGPALVKLRIQRIALVVSWIDELRAEQAQLAARVHPSMRKFAEKPTLVLQRLLATIGSPAQRFLSQIHAGLPDVGRAAPSGIFPPLVQRDPPLEVPVLLQGAALRNQELIDRVRRHHPYSHEVWDQGVAAEHSGALGPALPLEAWEDEKQVVFCRKFAVLQCKPVGDELSEPVEFRTEVRACVDNSSSPAGSRVNLAWAPAERIVCSDAEVISTEMVASQRMFSCPPVGGKEDLKKAYHQVPRCRSAIRIVQLLWHPSEKRVVGREQFAQDFGGSGPVTNCNVLFRSLRDIANRWLFVNTDN